MTSRTPSTGDRRVETGKPVRIRRPETTLAFVSSSSDRTMPPQVFGRDVRHHADIAVLESMRGSDAAAADSSTAKSMPAPRTPWRRRGRVVAGQHHFPLTTTPDEEVQATLCRRCGGSRRQAVVDACRWYR